MSNSETYLPIGDYALISDCHSTALVSRHGSIDWACLRRFDRGSTFAHLLDSDRGGRFLIGVQDPTGSSRRYVGDTMVLETTLTSATGTATVTDCFCMRSGGASDPRAELIRRIVCTAGTVELDVEITPRFDYGAAHPWLRCHDGGVVSAVAGDDALVIASDIGLEADAGGCAVTASVTLHAGDRRTVTTVAQPAHLLDPSAATVVGADDRIAETIDWWADWSARTVVSGRHDQLVTRSALVLKALCCAPTGAIIAAPTTSLPEIDGGSANWDYRYCWVRDATLTLEALQSVGHSEVARGFRDFIMRTTAGRGNELQIMYGCYGERRLGEVELDLAGWRGSRPVRSGNGAADQQQLDVYGHLVDAMHSWQDDERVISVDEWTFLASVVNRAIELRHEPDAGIWESRGEPQHYVHSKVMIWVAIDRGIRLVESCGLDGIDLDAWKRARDDVRDDIETHGLHDGGFVSYYGATDVDASLLKLALVGFIDPSDPRMVVTVRNIEATLCDDHGLLRRHSDSGATVDGSAEGSFLLCSCWLVQVLARQGRVGDAEELFDRLVGLGNDVGLFAEEYDSTSGQFLGNFPQAFTHLGLIGADIDIRRALGSEE